MAALLTETYRIIISPYFNWISIQFSNIGVFLTNKCITAEFLPGIIEMYVGFAMAVNSMKIPHNENSSSKGGCRTRILLFAGGTSALFLLLEVRVLREYMFYDFGTFIYFKT